jgi:hypothetical protein
MVNTLTKYAKLCSAEPSGQWRLLVATDTVVVSR